jgi:hypothetical protein
MQDDDVVQVKPRFNIYTMMLLLSLFAIITGCVLLYLEMESYKPEKGGWPWETPKRLTSQLESYDGTTFALSPAVESVDLA